MKATFVIAAMVVALSAAALGAQADVLVTQPWVRGVVKGQTATGAFMTLETQDATSLIGAASPIANTVQIHEMKMQGDLMTMRPVAAINIPANTTLELKPGGYHLMLIGLTKPLTKGDKVPVKLTFRAENGAQSTVGVQAEVRDLTELGAPVNALNTGIGKSTGIVTSMNREIGSVGLDHKDIPGVMPAMVMEFYLKDKRLLDGLNVGDQVSFSLETKDDVIIDIKKQ